MPYHGTINYSLYAAYRRCRTVPASKGSDPGGIHQDRKALPRLTLSRRGHSPSGRPAKRRARDAMTFTIALIAIAAFLAGSAIGVLAILVAGIRSDDRAKNLTGIPRTGTAAVTRRLLGVGVRTPGAGRGTDQDPDSPKAI